MPHLRTNRDLLTAFRAGDRDALQKVYWLYVRAVEAVVRRLFQQAGSGRSNDVLDAVQETFIRAFSSAARQSYDGVRDYGPYLNMTARNVALRWLEKHGRERPVEPESLASRLTTANSAPEQDLALGSATASGNRRPRPGEEGVGQAPGRRRHRLRRPERPAVGHQQQRPDLPVVPLVNSSGQIFRSLR